MTYIVAVRRPSLSLVFYKEKCDKVFKAEFLCFSLCFKP